MTEKEFAALLLLEDKRLCVVRKYYRGSMDDGYRLTPYFNAVVVECDDLISHDVGEYKSRYYTVQKLIKIYYNNEHN